MSIENRTIRTTRILPFTSKQIYTAFASPEILTQWWGPDGFTNSFEVFEFKVGGKWKFVMHGPNGMSYDNESVFIDLDPERKVVIEHLSPPNFTLTVKLNSKKSRTELIWEQVFKDTKTALALRHIVEPANEQNLDRMTRVLSNAKLDN
jgi:uncharacterized protein YndB with AHSA1/START domain